MSGVTEREYRGCSERACASGSRATDGRDVGVDRAPLELVQRQRQQQVDPPAEQQERIPERRPLPGLVALYLSGIRHAPVGDQWLSWKDRARLLRSIAHGDHVVPGLALQAIERARRMAGPGDAVRTQRLDCVGVHLRGWLGAGALSLEPPLPLPVEQSLRHLATGGIPSAQKQHPEATRPVHAGLRAQMNAPMILPAT